MNYSIFSVPKHNMTLAFWTDANHAVVLMNYMPGILSDVNDFIMPPDDLRPNVLLTDYVKKQVEGNPKWGVGSFSTNHADLDDLLCSVCEYIRLYHDQFLKRVRIPKNQIEIVREALEHYREHLDMTKGDDDSIENQHLEFDLITLEGIFSTDYGIDVVISEDDKDSFASKHGVDFPEFITITNK